MIFRFPSFRQLTLLLIVVLPVSHWMLKADEIDNINLQTTKNQYIRENGILSSCQVQFSAEDFAASDYEKITIKHMGLPIVLFIVCCALAMFGHYCKILLDCLGFPYQFSSR